MAMELAAMPSFGMGTVTEKQSQVLPTVLRLNGHWETKPITV